MARDRTRFVCQACGAVAPRWLGRCPDCGTWDGLIEEVAPRATAAPRAAPAGRPHRLAEIEAGPDEERIRTGIAELDRILGGGAVRDSAILVGGEPGIGKSTLLLDAAARIARAAGPTLYATGEESERQIRARAERLGIRADDLFVLAETDLEAILGAVESIGPAALIVDSIQTLSRASIPSAPGSVSQVRECAAALVRDAKARGYALFAIGHVTKDGAIAGPKILEHLVDAVLYFEGEGSLAFRILRCVKNRFGSVDEIGIFRMTEQGLEEVPNPSDLFLSERDRIDPGAVVVPAIEGTRPLLVEIQALVAESNYQIPNRRVAGLDPNRVAMLVALAEKRLGLRLGRQDVFVNVVGGVRVPEPAADLGALLAIASGYLERAIPGTVVVAG
ncbi:MAG: DNA repair protein RadA, partial [Planctomycetes bacterium]|nr:DNA repair protein RadA [Planctomycetota bacterium]